MFVKRSMRLFCVYDVGGCFLLPCSFVSLFVSPPPIKQKGNYPPNMLSLFRKSPIKSLSNVQSGKTDSPASSNCYFVLSRCICLFLLYCWLSLLFSDNTSIPGYECTNRCLVLCMSYYILWPHGTVPEMLLSCTVILVLGLPFRQMKLIRS